MSPGRLPRTAARVVTAAALATVGSLAWATPASAHAVGGGELPAPTWLLAYGGAALALIVAVALPTAPRTVPAAAVTVGPPTGPAGPGPASGPLRWLGTALYVLVVVLAFSGPDSAAGNLTTSAVLVVFWVGLPLLCLAAGDVFARLNPFDPVVEVVERAVARRGGRPASRTPPAWSGAAFLAMFSWFVVAYHRPGSPRAIGVLLVAYAALAVGGGLVWGRRWLRTGEAFGALSAGLAHLRRPARPAPPGLAALAVVWLGGTAFEAVAATGFWFDLAGTARGWERTVLDSIGLVWVLTIATGAVLGAARLADHLTSRGQATTVPMEPSGAVALEAGAVALEAGAVALEAGARSLEAGADRDAPPPARPVGSVPGALAAATLAVAASWFVLHDLSLLLFEGQNFLALASDPISRGWDLFGTIDRSIDIGVVESTWVRWTHMVVLVGGHVLAVVAAHRTARALALGARRAASLTWAAGSLAAAGVVVASLLVLE